MSLFARLDLTLVAQVHPHAPCGLRAPLLITSRPTDPPQAVHAWYAAAERHKVFKYGKVPKV